MDNSSEQQQHGKERVGKAAAGKNGLQQDAQSEEGGEENVAAERVFKERAIADKRLELRNEFEGIVTDQLRKKSADLNAERENARQNLWGILDELKAANLAREGKHQNLQDVLHIERMKNSAAEAMILDPYLSTSNSDADPKFFTTLNGAKGDGTLEVAYYFPLRNEKNTGFLQIHIEELEKELVRSNRQSEISEAICDSLRMKHSEIKKDLQILQSRIIDLRKVCQNAESADDKARKASIQAANLKTNVRMKGLLIARMKEDYRQEYINFHTKVSHVEMKKAEYIEKLQSEVADTMLQVAELERLANGSRTELHIVENSWHVHKSDSRVAEILQTFETIDHYMNLAHSDQANVRPGSKQAAVGGEQDRGARKMPFLMEPQLTMSNQTNTDSDDESRAGKEDGHEDLMMIDQVDKSLGDTKRSASRPDIRPSFRLTTIRKKPRELKSATAQDPIKSMILKFESHRPETGMMGFADSAIKYYDDMERHMAFKYSVLVELFEGYQDRKDFFRALKTELRKQVELRGEKQDGPLPEDTDNEEFIPEERIPHEMPNMFEEVRRRVADGKSGGITESNLNKMELDIICMCEAAKEYVRWLGRALVLVYNTSAKSKVISEEFKDILKTIDPGIELSNHSASNSFSKDHPSMKQSVLIPAPNEDEFYGLDATDIETILGNGRVTSRLLPCLRRMLTVSVLNDNLIKVFLTKQTTERVIEEIASKIPPEKPWSRNVHKRILEALRDQVYVRINDHIEAQCKKTKYALQKLQDRIIERYENSSASVDTPRVTLFSVYSSITPFYRQKMLEKVESEREKKEPKVEFNKIDKVDYAVAHMPEVSMGTKAGHLSSNENSVGKHLLSSTANPSTYQSYNFASTSGLPMEKPYRFAHSDNNYDQLLETILSRKTHQETVKSTKKKADSDVLFRSYYGQSETPVFQMGVKRSQKFLKPAEQLKSPVQQKVSFNVPGRAQTARAPIKVVTKADPVSATKIEKETRRSSLFEASRQLKESQNPQLDELDDISSVYSANHVGKPVGDAKEREFREFDDNNHKEVRKIIANMRLLDRVSTLNSIKEMRNDEIVQIVTRLNEEKNAVQRVIKKVKQFNASSPHRIGLPTTPRGLDVKVSRFDQSGSLTQRQLYSSANTLSTHDKEWHSKARDITIRDEMPSAWAPSKSLHLRLGLAEESTHRSKPVLQTSSTARTIGSMPLTTSRAKLQPSSSTKATTRRFELDFEKEARSRAAKYQFPKLGSDPFFKKKV